MRESSEPVLKPLRCWLGVSECSEVASEPSGPRRLMNAVHRRMPIFTWLYLLAEWVREVLARVSARDLLPRDARETGRSGAPFKLFGTSERQCAGASELLCPRAQPSPDPWNLTRGHSPPQSSHIGL